MLASPLRAVLFDFNGVLVDDESIHYQTLRDVLAEEGIALDEQDYYRAYVGFDDRAAFRFALAAAGRSTGGDRDDDRVVAELCERKAGRYRDAIDARGFPAFPGSADLARRLAGQVPVGIVSGAIRAEIEAFLVAERMLELIDPLVSADDVRASKPDPEGYLAGLRGLLARPELTADPPEPVAVLAIEDTPAGLEAARAAGLSTLAVAHTFPAERLGMADRVVERLDQIDADELLHGWHGVVRSA